MKYLSTVKHNGEYFTKGMDVVKSDYSKEELQALIDAGAVGTIKEEVAEDATTTTQEVSDEVKALKKMNKTQLLALAEEKGIEVQETMTNAELVEVLS